MKVLDVNAVSWFWESKKAALEGVTLPPLHVGNLTCVCGGNGAGKSTLFQLVNGNLSPQSGTIDRFGNLPWYIPQDPENGFAPAMTIVENAVARCGQYRHMPRCQLKKAISAALELSGYGTIATSLDRPAASYSGGQLQAIAIAIASVSGAKLVLLDEPTSRVDEDSRLPLWQMLQQLKKSAGVLVVTHDQEMASRFADCIVTLHHGRLIEP